MNQFYAEERQNSKARIELTGQEALHASKVLRKGKGEEILITDGRGSRYHGVIDSASKNNVSVAVKKVEKFNKSGPAVVLALGLIKKRGRLEFALEKATELGVSEILLFRGDHSESFNIRMDRAESAVMSAMKQSLRVFLPPVKAYPSLDELLSHEENSQIIHADQHGDANYCEIKKNTERVVMVVGPEGGLSERERGVLRQAGAEGIRLGDYRLRAETAALVMVSRYGNSAEVRPGE